MNKHEKTPEKHAEAKDDNEDSCCEDTCCCEDECGSEGISVKEVAYHADDKIDALIQLLIKKKLIKDSEFEEEYNSLFEEEKEE